jgi:hypothetical protein
MLMLFIYPSSTQQPNKYSWIEKNIKGAFAPFPPTSYAYDW